LLPGPPGDAWVALVVGNNAYSGLSSLVNAADAELIAAELQRAGSSWCATPTAAACARSKFSARAEGGAEAVFYFAGHGIQVRTICTADGFPGSRRRSP
jgi:uncharacterized caspase-like protein